MSGETPEVDEVMPKIHAFIIEKYGSISAFKLLKYFVEHHLVQETEGFANYELAFGIAPSKVLTRKALVKIECIADDNNRKEAGEGLDLLIKMGILKCDAETQVLELGVPLNSITDIFLKEKDSGFREVSEQSSADVVLLPALKIPVSEANPKPQLGGVPDILYKKTVIEIKMTKLPLSYADF